MRRAPRPEVYYMTTKNSKTADEETNLRYQEVAERKLNHEGRIGYTWRFFPNEAQALDARIAKDGYSDRTSWFREVVLKLPPHERATKAAVAKPKKAKGKKAAKKAAAKPKGVRKSKADIGPAVDAPAAE
jgi:hypothetical protein